MVLYLPKEAHFYVVRAYSHLLFVTANSLNALKNKSFSKDCLSFHISLLFSYKLFWFCLHEAILRLNFQGHLDLEGNNWFSFQKREAAQLIQVKFRSKLHECSLKNVSKSTKNARTFFHISKASEFIVVSKQSCCKQW